MAIDFQKLVAIILDQKTALEILPTFTPQRAHSKNRAAQHPAPLLENSVFETKATVTSLPLTSHGSNDEVVC